MECFRCGASDERVRLHDAISGKGIVKVCDDCASLERLPIIKRATEKQIEESQRHVSMRDRLAGMNRGRIAGREVTLRDLIDKNINAGKIQPHPDLIENFHWTIQRIRRARKITREEFAKGISEPESTIRMVEQGFLPENNYKVINKIESFFGVTLRKSGSSGFPDTNLHEPSRRFVLDNSLIEKEKEPPKRLSFNRDAARQLKISDLKDMKKKQDEAPKSQPVDSWEEEYSEDDEKFLDKQEDFDEED